MSMGGDDQGLGKKSAKEGKNADKAAAKLGQYGDEVISFTKDFYSKYVQPTITSLESERDKGIARADDIYGKQMSNYADREATYQQNGKPAINKYFDTVNNFDPEAEAQRRGISVQGDVVAAQANAQQQTNRALQARGINPNSGAAINAQSRGDVAGSLVRAQEMARLRNITTQQGLDMTSQAAGFGATLGGQAAAMPGQSLQAGVIGSDIAKSAGAGTAQAAGIPLAGYQQASQNQSAIFGPTKAAQTGLASQGAQIASQDGGIGGLLGTIAGGFLGGPGGAVVGKAMFG